MATRTPFEVISHTRQVCSLYKRICRDYLSWYPDRATWHYHVALVRADFEKNRNVKDMGKAKQLIEAAEKQLAEEMNYKPFVYPDSPGGSAYERYVVIPDAVLDFWDPVEKAQYPKYFAQREARKQEYLQLWEKKHGKPKEGKPYEECH